MQMSDLLSITCNSRGRVVGNAHQPANISALETPIKRGGISVSNSVAPFGFARSRGNFLGFTSLPLMTTCTHEQNVVLQIQRDNGVDEESLQAIKENLEMGRTISNLQKMVSVATELFVCFVGRAGVFY